MSVDRDEVRRIAELARLSLDDGETQRLTEEMNRILDHAERLRNLGAAESDHKTDDEVTGGGREPFAGATPEADDAVAVPEADDTVAAPDVLMRGLADFAPEMHDGFFTVPPPPGVVATDP
mgnify:FL=1